MLNPLQLIAYFRIFQKYVGKRLIMVFLLSLLAVVVESFGITLILPLIASLGMESDTLDGGPTPRAVLWVNDVVRMLGLQGSTIGIIVFIGVLVGFKGLIRFCADAYGSILTAQLTSEIKRKMFQAYAGMSHAYYSAHNTGHFTNVINSQISRLIQSFNAFKTLIISILTTSAYFAVALLVDWRFALMAAVFGGSVLLVFRRLGDYVKQLSRKTATEQSTLNKRLVQCLQAHKYLTATGNMAPLEQGIFQSIHRLTRYARNQGLANAFTGSVREPISVVVILLVLIVQIRFFQAPIAPILVSLILLYRAMGQIMLLQSTWQILMSTAGSIEVVEEEFANITAEHEPDGTIGLAPLSRGIELDNVDFSYGEITDSVLNGINLTISARHTFALVGPSGAGKSTLVDLITLLLKPTTGRLRIDGLDANEIKRESWHRQIGYVCQDTVVFDDTVANNIGLWQGDFDKNSDYAKRICAAAAAANAREFIDALPEGFQTVVGDRGIRLSGGQKQRLFIARELFRQPNLLILDEATSALDSASERAIQSSIDNLKGEITIIIIAHRLSTIRNADTVCVLEKGRIIEKGNYDELIKNEHSYFGKMVAAQVM
jgi:ABC-type multidrug transport system fused ATPase/permease subunit